MVWEWEKQAMRGEPMPGKLSLEDQAAYQAVSALHARYSIGRITREQASKEKEMIRRTYQKRIETAEFADMLCNYQAKLYKNIELAVYNYQENPSVELADKLISAIYGIEYIKKEPKGEKKNE